MSFDYQSKRRKPPIRKKYPKGKCSGCGGIHAIIDGKMWNHGDVFTNKQCVGAGKPPMDSH